MREGVCARARARGGGGRGGSGMARRVIWLFLGLGVAWSVAAVYWAVQGRPFEVRTGTLAVSVTLFTVFAFVGIAVLLYRRRPHIGGELGGPRTGPSPL